MPDSLVFTPSLLQELARQDVARALAEDLGAGDLTAALVDPSRRAVARVAAVRHRRRAVRRAQLRGVRDVEGVGVGGCVVPNERASEHSHGPVVCVRERECVCLCNNSLRKKHRKKGRQTEDRHREKQTPARVYTAY